VFESKGNESIMSNSLIHEILSKKSQVRTIQITSSQVTSFRLNQRQEKTLRIYEDGKIGVCGSLINEPLSVLKKGAKANLKLAQIEYPCDLGSEIKIEKKHFGQLNEKNAIKNTTKLLEKLTAKCPNFIFEGQIKQIKVDESYINSNKRVLKYAGSGISVELGIKQIATTNILDTQYGVLVEKLNINNIVSDVSLLHKVFFNETEVEVGDQYILVDPDFFVDYILDDLNMDKYFTKASRVAGKLNELVFNPNLSVYMSSDSQEDILESFYDDEGEFSEDNKVTLIANGVIKQLLGNKKTADKYHQPSSKSSVASYDGVPSTGVNSLTYDVTHIDYKQLIKDHKVIYLDCASGGDMTSTGDFATPVQSAYIFENAKMTKHVKDFNISGNIFKLLGEDYLGMTDITFLKAQKKGNLALFKMKVTK
jgi:PmbA protein